MTRAQHTQGSLQDRAVLQLAMRLELLQIEPVEQPHGEGLPVLEERAG